MNSKQLCKVFEEICKKRKIRIKYEKSINMDKESLGGYSPERRTIGLKKSLKGIKKVWVLTHELAHSLDYTSYSIDQDEEQRAWTISEWLLKHYNASNKIMKYFYEEWAIYKEYFPKRFRFKAGKLYKVVKHSNSGCTGCILKYTGKDSEGSPCGDPIVLGEVCKAYNDWRRCGVFRGFKEDPKKYKLIEYK